MRTGSFRADLFYRLAAFPLTLPPLRERREDIPQLAGLFLEKSAESANKSIRGMDPGTLQVLLAHDWPGNVRELKNAIERAVLLETTDRLQVSSLPSQFVAANAAGDSPARAVRVSAYDPCHTSGAGGASNFPLIYRRRKDSEQAQWTR